MKLYKYKERGGGGGGGGAWPPLSTLRSAGGGKGHLTKE